MLRQSGGRRRLATRVLLLLTAATSAITATGAGAAQAATYPGNVTWSRYVTTMSMYTMGCNQGKSSDSLGQPHQMVILNFGDPGWETYGTWGAWDTAVGGFQTNGAIENAVKSYMQGFYDCTVYDSKSFLTVAPGVTNDGSGINSSAANALGAAWGNMVKDLNSWIVTRGMQYQLTAFGALDAEPSWGPYSYSQAWATGFMASNLNYYDFGSADGCPASGTGSCNNGWTQADEYALAWGNRTAIGVPQIYLPTQAQQWAAISAWGNAHTSSGPILWAAALSQYQACKDHGDPCTGEDNTPAAILAAADRGLRYRAVLRHRDVLRDDLSRQDRTTSQRIIACFVDSSARSSPQPSCSAEYWPPCPQRRRQPYR